MALVTLRSCISSQGVNKLRNAAVVRSFVACGGGFECARGEGNHSVKEDTKRFHSSLSSILSLNNPRPHGFVSGARTDCLLNDDNYYKENMTVIIHTLFKP